MGLEQFPLKEQVGGSDPSLDANFNFGIYDNLVSLPDLDSGSESSNPSIPTKFV